MLITFLALIYLQFCLNITSIFSLLLLLFIILVQSINCTNKSFSCRICLLRIYLFYFNFQFSALIVTFCSRGWPPTSSLRSSSSFFLHRLSLSRMGVSPRFPSFFYYIGWMAKFITPPSRYKDLSVKANGFHYPAVYDSTTLNGLIMLYLHYGKQFVKTILSAPSSGGSPARGSAAC